MRRNSGDWPALEALYRSSRDDVYAYALGLLGDPASAEDVTALSFERAYRRRASFDAGRGERRAWLFGIARNAALDELRRRRRLSALVTDPADPEASAVPDRDDDGEVLLRRTAVRAALDGLSARDREVIVLKFHVGLSHAELARVIGVSESNASTRLHRAITQLRSAVNAPA